MEELFWLGASPSELLWMGFSRLPFAPMGAAPLPAQRSWKSASLSCVVWGEQSSPHITQKQCDWRLQRQSHCFCEALNIT